MNNILKQRGFLGLLAAQFFGAMNDNVLKGVLIYMVVDGLWEGRLGDGGQGIVSVCFTLPFILLSGYAGQIADRFSKRTVTMWVKVAEIPIVIVAGIGFYTGSLWVTLFALVALTCQSSFFGPAKYGMIPELVADGELSRANGTINMMTNLAVIAGTLLAGQVSDDYSPQTEEDKPAAIAQVDAQAAVDNPAAVDGQAAGGVPPEGIDWLPGVTLTVIAIAGLIAALFLTRLPAGDRDLRFNWNPFSIYIATVRQMSSTRLLMVMMAWGYFYLLAGIALLILPEYTVVLGITRYEASVLMGVLGIAIGVGCAVAGLLSRHRIEPRLVPIGAAGLILFFVLLAAVTPWMPNLQSKTLSVAFSNVAWFLLGAGFFAGFYIVPLQALLQHLSPGGERGRFLGTANAVSFAFLTVAALLFRAIAPWFGNQPQHIFYVSAVLMALGAAFFLWRLRGSGVIFRSRGENTEI